MRTVPWVLLLCVLKSRLASPAILLDENTAFICDFETQPDGNSSTEWCGLGQNPSASGISWQRSNRTQTVGSTTLPQFDHTFNDPAFPGGTFLYLGTGSADESLAWTPKFQLNAYDRLACVSFYYQWFSEGEPLFKLSYMVNETAGSWESHSLDLTPSRSWTKTDFELRPSDQFSIVFLANLSGNGTFAVDDLTIYECYSSGDPPPGRPLPADPASTPGCNNQAFDLGTLVTESSGSRNFTNNINYPYGDYAESAQCRWFLRTGPQEAMKLTFHDLSMETPLDEKDGCNYDFLNIYEVSAVDYERVLREKPCSGALRQYPYKGPICVLDKHPQVHTASTSYTVIEFCSDYTSNYRGFYATFDIVARDSTVPSPSPSPVVLQASLQGSATDQVVSSPVNNATKKYDPDTRASWRIEAQECLKIKLLFVDAKNTEIRCSVRRLGLRKAICVGVEAGSPSGCQNHTIAVSFPMFKLEGGHGCPYDRVTVYDGQDKAAPILDTFCGFDRQPRRVVSTGSVAFVEFVSDSWLQHPGFTMKYESIPCGGYEFQCASRVQCVPASQVCNGHRDCGDGSDETSCGFLCGITAVSPNSQTHRIVGGREAKRNSWPWQVALLWDIGDQFCGGVLIHPFYVMTAAHCVDKIDIHRMVLRFAAHDVTAEEPLTEDVLIETAVVHPGYDKLTHQNDIALLKLQKPAMFRREVLPACLARANQDVPVDTMCTATGWGDTTGYFGRGGIIAPPSRIVHRVDDEVKPNVLKEVSLPIVSQESCRLAYGPALTEDMLCAGYREGGKDSCQGDSGGPLVCRQDDKWVLHGIVSWGEGSCASPGIPGIYARVSHFAEWIENTMARLSHSPGNVSSLT